jgi:prepilin-type N-terminal cleavage/methylation domain-containing protein
MANRRNKRSGFTLIELMVVILILGILAGVAGVAVAGIIGQSKVRLDARALDDYAKWVKLAMQDERGRNLPRNYTDKGKTTADLFKWMVERNIMDADQSTKLAGASGTKASAGDWANSTGDALVGMQAIIYTAPNEGAEFFRRATQGKMGVDGVFMCYNENFISNERDGIVILAAGTDSAKPMLPLDIKDEFGRESKETPVDVKIGDASFYGKFPFKGIPPK